MLMVNQLVGFGVVTEAGHGPGHVWNPSDKTANLTLSNSNQDVARSSGSGSYETVRAAAAITAGMKVYWEIKVLENATGNIYIGIMDTTTRAVGSLATGDSAPAGTTKSAQFRSGIAPSGNYYAGMTGVAGSAITFANNDIYNFAIDYDAGKGWFGQNGTYVGSGNPGAGTNHTFTFSTSNPIYPAATIWDGTGIWRIIDGFTTAFTYAVPSGFIWYGDIP